MEESNEGDNKQDDPSDSTSSPHRIREAQEALSRQLLHRSTKQELVQRGILRGYGTSPKLHAKQDQLQRAQIGNSLEKNLAKRPSVQELKNHNILKESSVEPRVAGRMQDINRHQLQTRLASQLTARPHATELVHRNILHRDASLAAPTAATSFVFQLSDNADSEHDHVLLSSTPEDKHNTHKPNRPRSITPLQQQSQQNYQQELGIVNNLPCAYTNNYSNETDNLLQHQQHHHHLDQQQHHHYHQEHYHLYHHYTVQATDALKGRTGLSSTETESARRNHEISRNLRSQTLAPPSPPPPPPLPPVPPPQHKSEQQCETSSYHHEGIPHHEFHVNHNEHVLHEQKLFRSKFELARTDQYKQHQLQLNRLQDKSIDDKSSKQERNDMIAQQLPSTNQIPPNQKQLNSSPHQSTKTSEFTKQTWSKPQYIGNALNVSEPQPLMQIPVYHTWGEPNPHGEPTRCNRNQCAISSVGTSVASSTHEGTPRHTDVQPAVILMNTNSPQRSLDDQHLHQLQNHCGKLLEPNHVCGSHRDLPEHQQSQESQIHINTSKNCKELNQIEDTQHRHIVEQELRRHVRENIEAMRLKYPGAGLDLESFVEEAVAEQAKVYLAVTNQLTAVQQRTALPHTKVRERVQAVCTAGLKAAESFNKHHRLKRHIPPVGSGTGGGMRRSSTGGTGKKKKSCSNKKGDRPLSRSSGRRRQYVRFTYHEYQPGENNATCKSRNTSSISPSSRRRDSACNSPGDDFASAANTPDSEHPSSPQTTLSKTDQLYLENPTLLFPTPLVQPNYHLQQENDQRDSIPHQKNGYQSDRDNTISCTRIRDQKRTSNETELPSPGSCFDRQFSVMNDLMFDIPQSALSPPRQDQFHADDQRSCSMENTQTRVRHHQRSFSESAKPPHPEQIVWDTDFFSSPMHSSQSAHFETTELSNHPTTTASTDFLKHESFNLSEGNLFSEFHDWNSLDEDLFSLPPVEDLHHTTDKPLHDAIGQYPVLDDNSFRFEENQAQHQHQHHPHQQFQLHETDMMHLQSSSLFNLDDLNCTAGFPSDFTAHQTSWQEYSNKTQQDYSEMMDTAPTPSTYTASVMDEATDNNLNFEHLEADNYATLLSLSVPKR